MIKLVHLVSTVRTRALLCGCAAVLLSACGGNGGASGAAGPANRTAAEVLDSETPAVGSFDPRDPAVAEAAAAAAIAGTSADETAGPAPVQASAEEIGNSGAALQPQQANEAPAPVLPAASTQGASAGATRIFVAGTPAPAI